VPAKKTTLHLAGRDVDVSNPDKHYFEEAGVTKLGLVEYYLSVGDGVLRALRGRPMVLKRYVHGAAKEPFFQKRAPDKRPEWIETATFRYPSGGVADEIVVNDLAALAWVVNLGNIEMHVHPIRQDDLEHPDELRIDLDPQGGVTWQGVIDVARVAEEVLADFGLIGFPKTSGSRGVHIWVRIERNWRFDDVKKAGLALAREIERRAPEQATSKWRKEERHGVLVDYNQNAKDRTTAAAWSARATPDARVSMPLTWAELYACDPRDFTVHTAPALFRERGDPHAAIDDVAHSLAPLLELAGRQGPRKPSSAKQRAKENPVITVARAKTKPEALDGLERWKGKHPEVARVLTEEDVLVDAMRGKSSAWYRVRVNLRHVPEGERPEEGELEVDYDPAEEWAGEAGD
jgi:bifunctional non-homologous end joining protein LigD